MQSRLIFLLPVFALLLAQCAKQTTPGGGPKDIDPPKFIQSNPPDRQTSFSKNEIELTFDEAIQLNNPREQIVITPTIGKKFEAIARKNKVTLKLNADLLENTTYTISFREAIQDLTEKNPAVNLKLAFSTGPYIDSLSIKGIVNNLLEGKPNKNFTVAAAPYHDTVNIFKHEAQWITLTNEKGEYSLDNLKAGEYIVYAFDDKNKNLIVDSKSEHYGFIAKPTDLQSNIPKLEIPTLKMDVRPFKLITAKPLSTYFNIRLSKGYSTYHLTTDSNQKLYSKSENSSTIRVYNTFPKMDSIQIHFTSKDSIDNQIDTLIYLKFDTRSTKEKFSSKLENLEYHENSSLLRGTITFNKPVVVSNYDSAFIQLDSVNFIRFDAADFKWENGNNELIIEKKLPKGTNFSNQVAPGSSRVGARNEIQEPEKREESYNQFIIRKGSFISAESDTSSSIQSSINTIKPENSGTLIIEVKTSDKVLIEILNKSYKLVTSSTQHQARLDNLAPGDYLIRVILDKNGNGKWDPGNYFNKEEPEPILFYKNEKDNQIVSIKANWEIGPLLITPEKDVDK